MSDKNKTKYRFNSFSSRNFKQGMYNSVVVAFVVAIVILFNLFIGQLGWSVDLTKESIYTLTEDTVDYAGSITDDITIYYVVKEGEEYEVLRNVVNEYNDFSHIDVEWKDPELYPQFTAEYTDETLEGNDIIVVNNTTGASRFIPFSDMYIVDQSINYTTMQSEYAYTLDAEGQITSALQYVTEEAHTKMYVVSAHGETALGQNMTELVEKSNIQVETLDVVSATEVPADCNILFINGPTTDITDSELAMYKSYLDNGGGAVLVAAYTEEPMPNYISLLEYYGVQVTDSVVLESEGQYLQNYPTYLVNSFESVTDTISEDFNMDDIVIVPIAQGLKLIDSANLRSTLEVSTIVQTSEHSYAKTEPEDTIEKTEGDIDGPFVTVVQASDTYKDKSSKVAIFASPYTFTDDWINYYECKNSDLFLDTLDWMRGEGTNTIAVPQRNLNQEYIDVPFGAATVWGAIVIVVIPLCILGTGLFVWYRRRKH